MSAETASPARVSKEEREAAKAADRAAKDAVKARKDAIKAQRTVYKGWCALLKSKEVGEVKEGLTHCTDPDFMTLGGGLVTLLRVLKSKVRVCAQCTPARAPSARAAASVEHSVCGGGHEAGEGGGCSPGEVRWWLSLRWVFSFLAVDAPLSFPPTCPPPPLPGPFRPPPLPTPPAPTRVQEPEVLNLGFRAAADFLAGEGPPTNDYDVVHPRHAAAGGCLIPRQCAVARAQPGTSSSHPHTSGYARMRLSKHLQLRVAPTPPPWLQWWSW
jgi:hypothetical protein